jgi:translation initiation factor IF-2
LLAAASQAVIIGFHVRPEPKAAELAVKEKVDIRLYKIIYEAESDIKAALEGLLAPEIIKIEIGAAEVRQIFSVPKIGSIAGSSVKSGSIKRGAIAEVYRNDELLRRFKDDVKEVTAGFECGIGIDPFPEIMEGDIIKVYQEIEEARKLG